MAWFPNPPTASAASSVNSSKAASEAFNNQTGPNSFWWSSGYAPQWLRAEFSAAQVANWYSVAPYPGDTNPPTAWTFQGSNDGTFASWTTLDTRSSVTYASGTQAVTFTFTNTTAYQYYRLNISAPTTGPGGSGIAVSELRIGSGSPASWLYNSAPAALTLTGDYTIGNVFRPNTTGNITHFAGFKRAATGTVVFKLYDSSGTVLATESQSQSALANESWFTTALSTPVALTSGTHYMVAAYYPGTSGYVAGPLNSSNVTWGDLIIPGNGLVTFDGSTANVRYSAGNAKPTSTAGDQHLVSLVFDPTTSSAVSVSAPALAVVEAAPAPTVSAGTSVSVAAAALAVTAALLAPTVSAGTGVLVDAPALAVVTAVPAPSVVMGGTVTVSAPVLGVVESVPAPVVSAGSTVTVAAPVLDLSTAIPAPTVDVSHSISVSAPMLALSYATPAPTVSAGSSASVDAPTLAVTFGVPVPTVTIGDLGSVNIAAPRLSLTIGMPEVGVVGPLPVERCVTSLTYTPVGVLSVIPLVPVDPLATAVPITRTSILAPNLSAVYPAHPAQGSVGAPEVITEVVGYPQLWIGGQNVTNLRGVPTILRRWESEAPFGDTVAAVEFPQLNPWDVPGTGDLAFLSKDAPVAIGMREVTVGDGFTVTRVRRLWSGFLDARGNGLGDGEDYSWEAKGTFWQAQSLIREPHPITEPVDIGVWIARVMNAVDGRRWATMPHTPIGITTQTRGNRDQYVMEYVQELLSEAITDDLRQWTLVEVAPGVPRLVLKPAPSTVHATVAYGTPGVDVDLRVDESTRVDRIFMRGIGPKMGGWANVFYPWLELATPPPYPMASLGDYLDLGTTDADTVSGTGVTDLQRRISEFRGFANPPISGVMSSAWMAVMDDVQRRVGVAADGSPGPQTWNAVFDRALSGVETTPRRLPMASNPAAEKYLYTATGVRLHGTNPAWDGRVPRDIALDIGPGKTKAAGFKLARKLLGIYGTAAANGQIVWTTDPVETDRTRLSHLSNIKVTGSEGSDRVVQVSSKSVELEAGEDGPCYVVTTRVDERARDAMVVEDLLEQRRSAKPDPSRRPGNPNRASRAVSDQRTPWDSESPCGVLRRTAVNGASGLWTVVTIPFAEVGKLAGIRLTSTRPFYFAIFASQRITENKMAAFVGDPSTQTDPWRDAKGNLDDYGIIEAWGEQGNACGYSPKTEADGGAFTGEFVLDTPVDYWTETIPYVSVAIFMSDGSGWIEGEFLPAYET